MVHAAAATIPVTDNTTATQINTMRRACWRASAKRNCRERLAGKRDPSGVDACHGLANWQSRKQDDAFHTSKYLKINK